MASVLPSVLPALLLVLCPILRPFLAQSVSVVCPFPAGIIFFYVGASSSNFLIRLSRRVDEDGTRHDEHNLAKDLLVTLPLIVRNRGCGAIFGCAACRMACGVCVAGMPL